MEPCLSRVYLIARQDSRHQGRVHLDKCGVVGEEGVKLWVLGVWVLCVGACKLAQSIWDDIFFACLVSNIQFELMQELRGPHKPQIEPHCWGGGCDWRLLENIDFCRVIRLNDNVWLRWLDYMPNLFYYPHKSGNLQLYWPIVLFGWGE